MHRRTSIQLLAACALALQVTPAVADDIGGSGFTVPPTQSDWLWGVEGLVRTPLDVSMEFGAMFTGYEMNARVTHDDRNGGAGTVNAVSDTLEIEPEGIEGGFRFAGGIGYWNCCVLIEPAVSVRWNRALGDNRTDDSPRAFDPSDANEFSFVEVEYLHGWDVAVGPQMTWMVQDSTPLIGGILGGLPLVFFPYLGVTHTNYDAEFIFRDNGVLAGAVDRNFEDDNFMVGFDLDIPLPGSHWNFTHALTFAFRWNNGGDSSDHDFGGFAPDTPGIPPAFLNVGGTARADSCNGNFGNDQVCFNLDRADGWRIGLLYRVTWNDFEGFFKRVVFGPVE